MERKLCSPRMDASLGVRARGTHSWAKPGLTIFGPMTPMMVCGSPSRLMDSADDVGIGGVVGLPELVAENDFVVSAGVIFFGQEDASVKRFDAEDGEEVGAYGACAD